MVVADLYFSYRARDLEPLRFGLCWLSLIFRDLSSPLPREVPEFPEGRELPEG